MSRKSNSSLPRLTFKDAIGDGWKYKTVSNQTLNKIFVSIAIICTLIIGFTIGKIYTARTIKVYDNYKISNDMSIVVLDIGGNLEEYVYFDY